MADSETRFDERKYDTLRDERPVTRILAYRQINVLSCNAFLQETK